MHWCEVKPSSAIGSTTGAGMKTQQQNRFTAQVTPVGRKALNYYTPLLLPLLCAFMVLLLCIGSWVTMAGHHHSWQDCGSSRSGRMSGVRTTLSNSDTNGPAGCRSQTRTDLLAFWKTSSSRTVAARSNPVKQERLVVLSPCSTASYADPCSYLLKSAAAVNISLVVVGAHYEQYSQLVAHAKTRKMQLLAQWLERQPLDDDTVVLVVDCLDVLLQKTEAQILSAYQALGSPSFMVSTETNCWPPDLQELGWCDRYPVPPNSLPTRYLNSGAYIGRAAVVRQYVQDFNSLLLGMPNNSKLMPPSCHNRASLPGDQGMMACAYLEGNPYNMSLDYDSSLFFSGQDSVQFLEPACLKDIHNKQPHFSNSGKPPLSGLFKDVRSGAVPAVLHFNGGGKENIRQIADAMWYNSDPGVLQHRPLKLDNQLDWFQEFCERVAQ